MIAVFRAVRHPYVQAAAWLFGGEGLILAVLFYRWDVSEHDLMSVEMAPRSVLVQRDGPGQLQVVHGCL